MAGRAELLTAVGGLAALTLAAAAALRFATTAAARRAFGGEGRVRWELVALRAALSFAIRTCTYLGRDVAWDGERFELKGTGEVRRRRGRRRRDRRPMSPRRRSEPVASKARSRGVSAAFAFRPSPAR